MPLTTIEPKAVIVPSMPVPPSPPSIPVPPSPPSIPVPPSPPSNREEISKLLLFSLGVKQEEKSEKTAKILKNSKNLLSFFELIFFMKIIKT